MDALLSLGGCSQIHWYLFRHFELSIFPLYDIPQSPEFLYLGETAYLSGVVTAPLLWTPLPTGPSPAGAGREPGTGKSLRKGHIPPPSLLLCHLEVWMCTRQLGSAQGPLPTLGHFSLEHHPLCQGSLTGVKQHLPGTIKGQMLVPWTAALTSKTACCPAIQQNSSCQDELLLRSSMWHHLPAQNAGGTEAVDCPPRAQCPPGTREPRGRPCSPPQPAEVGTQGSQCHPSTSADAAAAGPTGLCPAPPSRPPSWAAAAPPLCTGTVHDGQSPWTSSRADFIVQS